MARGNIALGCERYERLPAGGERLLHAPKCWNTGRCGLGARPHRIPGSGEHGHLMMRWRWDEGVRVNGHQKGSEGAAALPLLFGEEGIAAIAKLLTVKVMQGLRSIRVPVIIYREGKKTTLGCENRMARQRKALEKGFLKPKVIHDES